MRVFIFPPELLNSTEPCLLNYQKIQEIIHSSAYNTLAFSYANEPPDRLRLEASEHLETSTLKHICIPVRYLLDTAQ